MVSPLLIPDFTIVCIFLHNTIQIFFQDDSRDRKRKDVFLIVCLGNCASHCWLPGLCVLNGLSPFLCCGQEPGQLVKQHSNRGNKPNSSMWLAWPCKERESEMQPIYIGRRYAASFLLMRGRICTAPWQLLLLDGVSEESEETISGSAAAYWCMGRAFVDVLELPKL